MIISNTFILHYRKKQVHSTLAFMFIFKL